jgi:lysozyme
VNWIQQTTERIRKHEGIILKPYKDSVGILTIGYGRNLESKGITLKEADVLLRNDVFECIRYAEILPWFDELDDVRKSVIVEMLFNLGPKRFMSFKGMIEAIANGQFEIAADEMLDSLWAKQVKGRARTLAQLMNTGGNY